MNRASLALGAALFILWQSAATSGWVSASILPGPFQVIRSLLADYTLWLPHLGTTVFTAVIGFLLSIVLALIISLAMDRLAVLRRALYPWLLISQMVPIIFIYPLMLIWLGFGIPAKVAVVTLVCFFPMAISLTDGLQQTSPAWQRMLRSYGATRWQQFCYLRFPAALPSAFSGLRISATYCIMAAVLGEWLGARSGLGVYMLRAYKSFNTPRVFSAVVLVVTLSLVLVALVRMFEHRFSYQEHVA